MVQHWKDHWPGVLLGAGVVIGGIVAIVKVHPFVGAIVIVIGVVIMIREAADTDAIPKSGGHGL